MSLNASHVSSFHQLMVITPLTVLEMAILTQSPPPPPDPPPPSHLSSEGPCLRTIIHYTYLSAIWKIDNNLKLHLLVTSQAAGKDLKSQRRGVHVAGPTGMFCSARCSCCDFTHSCRSPPPLHQKWNAFYLESRGPSWEKAFQLLFLTPFAFVCLLSPFSAPSLVISPCRVGFCAGGYFVCQCPRRPPAILHAAS